jgi:hypothetical protein
MPGRPVSNIKVAAEAQRIDRRANNSLDLRDRREIDDRDNLLRHVGKAVSGRVQYLRRPAQLVGAEPGKEALDRRAAFGAGEVAARNLPSALFDRKHMGRIVEAGTQAGEPLVAHQH